MPLPGIFCKPNTGIPGRAAVESGAAAPHSKTQAFITALESSATFWSAPVLWRFWSLVRAPVDAGAAYDLVRDRDGRSE